MDIGRSPDRVQLPPGFASALCEARPLHAAVAAARAGADPGTLLYGELGARCTFAVVLAPQRPVEDGAVLGLGARAVASALAAIAPAHVPVRISAAGVEVDGARAATLAVARAPTLSDGIPDWIVLEIDVAIDLHLADPGVMPGITCLAEEGFCTSAAEVLGATCRALLACLNDAAEAEMAAGGT